MPIPWRKTGRLNHLTGQHTLTEFQPQRALSNPNPNGRKTSQRTLLQPKMGV